MENRARGAAREGKAGGAVATVAIGLRALTTLSLPFLRSMRYGGMLIALISTLVAITLFWTRWARGIAQRQWIAAGASVVAVLSRVGAATRLNLGDSRPDAIARPGDASGDSNAPGKEADDGGAGTGKGDDSGKGGSQGGSQAGGAGTGKRRLGRRLEPFGQWPR
jgi:hypothetical protein